MANISRDYSCFSFCLRSIRENNQLDIVPIPREAFAAVKGEEVFVELLRRKLRWLGFPFSPGLSVNQRGSE